MNMKDELIKGEGEKYQKDNGIVMRCIVTLFRRGWFKTKELMQSLEAYNLTCENVTDAICYFSDRHYIETREEKNKEIIRACDAESIFDLEIRLCADGVLIGKSLLEDIGIDL